MAPQRRMISLLLPSRFGLSAPRTRKRQEEEGESRSDVARANVKKERTRFKGLATEDGPTSSPKGAQLKKLAPTRSASSYRSSAPAATRPDTRSPSTWKKHTSGSPTQQTSPPASGWQERPAAASTHVRRAAEKERHGRRELRRPSTPAADRRRLPFRNLVLRSARHRLRHRERVVTRRHRRVPLARNPGGRTDAAHPGAGVT